MLLPGRSRLSPRLVKPCRRRRTFNLFVTAGLIASMVVDLGIVALAFGGLAIGGSDFTVTGSVSDGSAITVAISASDDTVDFVAVTFTNPVLRPLSRLAVSASPAHEG